MPDHEAPWDLAAKILDWNKRYAAEAKEAQAGTRAGQPPSTCGKRLRECVDDVCRSMGECAWPPHREDARAAGHAREGTGGADSVSSEVTASARPAGTARFDWLASAGIPPPPEDWPPDDPA